MRKKGIQADVIFSSCLKQFIRKVNDGAGYLNRGMN